jgi:hypothetical protein
MGKHLQDHLMCPLIYPAPGIGVPMNDVVQAMGPDALRAHADSRCFSRCYQLGGIKRPQQHTHSSDAGWSPIR